MKLAAGQKSTHFGREELGVLAFSFLTLVLVSSSTLFKARVLVALAIGHRS